MLKIIASILFLLSASYASAAQSESESIEKAQIAARNWLVLVDSEQYSATWEQAATLFQAAITKQKWEDALKSARSSVGAIESRLLVSASYSEQLPGAPEGQYVVIQFNSTFTNKKNVIETVTPMLDKDGGWRVSGYFIQ